MEASSFKKDEAFLLLSLLLRFFTVRSDNYKATWLIGIIRAGESEMDFNNPLVFLFLWASPTDKGDKGGLSS
ncbi:hypothetical protein COT40_00700 [Candidatus Peregrinibacteria bacterium CG08_land_8_20_14_0_20_41_10]|nr:MAG: hypothetical protein COT40_00700 [Candidatus Peregrinibacteria bacterium CG08_land_8_20_14_0_20_41_10]